MKIVIMRDTMIDGAAVAAGQMIDADDSTAIALVQMRKARPAEDAAAAAPETATAPPAEDAKAPAPKPRRRSAPAKPKEK